MSLGSVGSKNLPALISVPLGFTTLTSFFLSLFSVSYFHPHIAQACVWPFPAAFEDRMEGLQGQSARTEELLVIQYHHLDQKIDHSYVKAHIKENDKLKNLLNPFLR